MGESSQCSNAVDSGFRRKTLGRVCLTQKRAGILPALFCVSPCAESG